MKILLVSYVFSPSIGGIESISEMLAREFVRAGHDVKLVTSTSCIDSDDGRYLFPVIRQPSLGQQLHLTQWADVVFHNNISLRMAWLPLLMRRPWVVTHQTWLPHGGGYSGVIGWMKRLVLRWATGVAISRAIADDLQTPSYIIPNPYDADTFHRIPNIPKEKDLVFVGRLINAKGLSVLFDAMKILREQDRRPKLTVIGVGPDEPDFRSLSLDLGLAAQVEFAGAKRGVPLAEAVNQHKVMVVPSLWNEPFGIVALEGIACGCLVIGSSGGGLQDAVGPCGITFPNGDAKALAACLEQALYGGVEIAARSRAAAPAHLAAHSASAVAQRYLELFSCELNKGRHVAIS
jgi:glycogen(starch) synthase